MSMAAQPDGPRFCPMCASPMEKRTIAGHQRPACPLCGHVAYLDPKVVVLVIIEVDGKLVLGRRRAGSGQGLWSFPSGYVDRGEALEQAARRETREETGLEVELVHLVGVYSRAGNPIVLVAYTGRVVGGRMEPGEEMDEVGLFAPDALPPMAFDSNEGIVRDWNRIRPFS